MEVKVKEIGLILVIYGILTLVRYLIVQFVAFDYISSVLYDLFFIIVIMSIGVALIQIDRKK